MEIRVATDTTESQLKLRGVVVEGRDGEVVRLRCRQCGERWQQPAGVLEEPPSERNRYWWCPNGCNREE